MITFNDVKIIQDIKKGKGPLMGIFSGLQASSNVINFVIAVDIPEINFAAIFELLSNAEDYDISLMTVDGKRPEALFGFYKKSVIPIISANLEKNIRKCISGFLMGHIKYTRNIKYLLKALLGYLAYVSFFPISLSPILNKIRGVKIKDPFKVYIAPNVIIDTIFPELVTIEKDVYITRGARIIAHFNPTNMIAKIIKRENIKGKIHIREGAFIGVNAIVLPNVVVGRCAIVGAGSVVVNDVEDYAIMAGNPAKKVGDIRDKNWKDLPL